VVVDEAHRRMHRAASPRCEKSAKPSPCATAIGMRLPAMPVKKIDGLSSTSTRRQRASNCSLRLRVNAARPRRRG
jgi:hypothetical protein